MADQKLKTFVLNDENVVNSYDFRVRNSGLDFARFEENPVMLDSHINRTDMVRGNWQNHRFEGAKLLAEANFDLDDPESKKLEGKVSRGFVKGASLGLAISWSEECFQRQPDGIWDLIKAEVVEASVCGVPSNSGALALYNKETGDLIPEDQIKLSFKNLSIDKPNSNNLKMDKIILSVDASRVLVGLGFANPETINQTQISEAFVKLNADLETSKTKVSDLQGKLDKQLTLQAETLIDQAIADEKLTAGERDAFIQDAKDNYALTAKLIGKMPGKVSLSGKVNNPAGGAQEAKVKTKEEFFKLSAQEQLSFKVEQPEAYAALWKKAK